MTRMEFLKLIGAGTVASAAIICLGSCSSSNPAAPQKVDFTIDISQSPYNVLSTQGGYIVKDDVIVAHTINDTFVAIRSVCTHQGGTLQYIPSINLFQCPNHGSQFKTDGSLQRGPAAQAEIEYNVTVTGNIIRVFS